MQDVRSLKKLIPKSFLIIVALCIFLVSCEISHSALQPTNNKGGYTIKFNSSTKNRSVKDSTVIYGHVKDVTTKEGIYLANVNWFCANTSSSIDGFYKMTVPSGTSLTSYLVSKAVGYRTVETDTFRINAGDSIRLNFFLQADHRPIVHCDN